MKHVPSNSILYHLRILLKLEEFVTKWLVG